MRSLFLALLLVLAFAGGAQAQQRVRTGALPPATAQARPRAAPAPARMVRQVKARFLVGRGKASPAVRASAQRAGSRRSPVRQPKRPAPRG